MNEGNQLGSESEQRVASRLLDVLIRAGLILAMAMLCYRVFSPFLTLMAWAVILAVTLYPLHQALAAKMREKQGLAATVLVLLGIVLIVTPTAVLMSSLGDSVHQLVRDVEANSLAIPAPRDGVAEWPVIGEKVHALWSRAHADLPALVQSLQPKIGELARAALRFVAGIGVGLLRFLAAFIVAGILMAFGQAGARSSRAIFDRVVGRARGAEYVRAVHGHDPCGRSGRHRCRLHPGDPRRPRALARGRAVCRRSVRPSAWSSASHKCRR